MATSSSTPATSPAITITRIFDAPRELVWKAWTDPERLVRWWGPKDYTSPYCKMDFRVGGTYLYCMRTPEGQEIWTTGSFREIVPLRRIVFTDLFADAQGNVVGAEHYGFAEEFPAETLITLAFEEQGGKTTLTLQHTGLPAGEHSDGAVVGWNEILDKLAASLK